MCTKQCSHSHLPKPAWILIEVQTNWIDITGWKKIPSQNENRLPIPARKYCSYLEKGNKRQLCIYLVQTTFLASFYFLIHMVHTISPPAPSPRTQGESHWLHFVRRLSWFLKTISHGQNFPNFVRLWSSQGFRTLWNLHVIYYLV